MSSGLGDVSIHNVETLDDACELKRWASKTRAVLAVDTETTGLSFVRDHIRMIQLGDTESAWAVSAEWKGVAYEILGKYDGQLVAHNLSFDAKQLEHSRDGGYKLNWSQWDDTYIMARLLDPTGPAGLKQLAAIHVDQRAAYASKVLDTAMAQTGWTWATVPINFEPYWAYAGLDCILTARLWEVMKPLMAPIKELYEMEMSVLRLLIDMEVRGCRIDLDYTTHLLTQGRAYVNQVEDWCKQTYGFAPGQAQKVAEQLLRDGVNLTEVTATGRWKLDAEVLEAASAHPLAAQVLARRKVEKISSAYLENFLTLADGDILHPSINSLAARTSRMCLPTSHMILTKRGVLSHSDVRVGDLTLDEHNEWVPVLSIHHYEDQPTEIWETHTHRLEATAEHRWVMHSERERRYLQPIKSSRHRVQLTPRRHPIPLGDDTGIPQTDGAILAALIGWLVSDGSAHVYRGDMKARVYQTERKFYKEMLAAVPSDAFMYDRITISDYHEVGIKVRWLRPRIEAAGFFLSEGDKLRLSDHLPIWVLSLSLDETRAFLRAVWLADGTTAFPVHKKICCDSPPLRLAIQIAAYRCGYTSKIFNDGRGGWSTKDRLGVKMVEICPTTRHLRNSQGRSDVWCVSTSSGTFTAWNNGPYLTGNSISDPALQQLPRGSTVRNCFIPRDGHVLLSVDYDQIEARLAAHFSQDPGLIAAFGGEDFFSVLGRDIFMDPNFTKSDPRRPVTKNAWYAKQFGAGVEKMAATAGVDVATMQIVSDRLDSAYPIMRSFQQRAAAVVREREQAEGQGYVVTPLGRRLPIDRDKSYVGVNTLIQGHAAEILKMAIISLDEADVAQWSMLPVHDEVVFSVPTEDAADVERTIIETMTRLDYAVPLTANGAGPLERWGEKK